MNDKAAPSDASTAMAIAINGKPYSLNPMDLSSNDVAALRQATGMSLRRVFELAETDPDIDVIAAFVWMARRAAGERNLRFESVASEIGYDSEFTVNADAEEGEAPEA